MPRSPNLPVRDPALAISDIEDRIQGNFTLDGWARTPRPSRLLLSSRVVAGHPDDADELIRVLQLKAARDDLLHDVNFEATALSHGAVKILSALYAADPSRGDIPHRVFAASPQQAVVDHLDLLKAASAHEKVALHGQDPDLRAILLRPWREPFHGHDHTPTAWRRVAALVRQTSRHCTAI